MPTMDHHEHHRMSESGARNEQAGHHMQMQAAEQGAQREGAGDGGHMLSKEV